MKKNNLVNDIVPANVRPPCAPEIECSVLGGILIEKEAVSIVADILIPDCFYLKEHILIYKAMIYLFESGSPIDVVTVYEELKKCEQIEEIGGAVYLSKLSQNISSAANIEHHAKIIYEKYILRNLITAAHNIAKSSYEQTEDAFDIIEAAEKQIFSVTQYKIGSYYPIKICVTETVNHIEKIIRAGHKELSTGLYDLDEYNVFEKSAMIILAARPSIGKTALALSIARNIAKNKPVGFFSLEMSKMQITTRLISSDSDITYKDLMSGKIHSDKAKVFTKAACKVSDLNLFIDDTAAINMIQLKSKARKMKIEQNIEVLIFDYLQLAHAKAESREREISTISGTLKQIAKELNIPVLVLSQLNRAAETRIDKRPSLADLRESGAIEQDADTVMLLYRPEFYKIPQMPDGSPTEGLAIVEIPKNRNGATGEFRLFFKKEIALFENIIKQDYQSMSHE